MIGIERFDSKIFKAGGCWLWTAGLNKYGYGQWWWKRKNVGAHCFSYKTMVGVIPDGLQLDHLCRNRACVNPEHLEAVTCKVNIMRGLTGERLAPDICKNGHKFTADNVKWVPRARSDGGGYRRCRTCANEYQRQWRKENDWRTDTSQSGLIRAAKRREYQREWMRKHRAQINV